MINTGEIAKEYRLSHWAQVMQRRTDNGMSIREYCNHIGIAENTYYYWQRRVRMAACQQLAETAQPCLPSPAFAEVAICEAPASPPAAAIAQLRIEIAGFHITADSNYPPETLAALLRKLVQPC
jgi:transposase-like protein